MPLKVLPGVLPPSQLLLEPPGWDEAGLTHGRWMGRVGKEGIVHPGEHLSPRMRSRGGLGLSRANVPLLCGQDCPTHSPASSSQALEQWDQ